MGNAAQEVERLACGAMARREREAGARAGEGREAGREERERSGEVVVAVAMAGNQDGVRVAARARACVLSYPGTPAGGTVVTA
jgi:hypothetical protein